VIAAILLAAATAAGAPATPAAAKAPAGASEAFIKRAPVRVDADEVQYAFQRKEVTFTGKRPVVLTRADATLSCRRIVAKTGETGRITAATCNGDVRFLRGDRVVTCDQAEFDDTADRVICEGNVVLKDAGSEAKGSRLVYDLKADNAKLENAVIVVPDAQLEQQQKALDDRRKEKKR
jgi:lipopolysaccharide export system protein LptA